MSINVEIAAVVECAEHAYGRSIRHSGYPNYFDVTENLVLIVPENRMSEYFQEFGLVPCPFAPPHFGLRVFFLPNFTRIAVVELPFYNYQQSIPA